jgi:hypothetical protein
LSVRIPGQLKHCLQIYICSDHAAYLILLFYPLSFQSDYVTAAEDHALELVNICASMEKVSSTVMKEVGPATLLLAFCLNIASCAHWCINGKGVQHSRNRGGRVFIWPCYLARQAKQARSLVIFCFVVTFQALLHHGKFSTDNRSYNHICLFLSLHAGVKPPKWRSLLYGK